jgi:FMN phosphatase YigB (HAD superfamily)
MNQEAANFILFIDYDGTLVDQNMKEAYRRLLVDELKHERGVALAEELYNEDRFLAKHGLYDRQYVFWKYAHEFPDVDTLLLCKKLWAHVLNTQRKKDDSPKVLQALKNAGHRLICVTDTDGPGGNKRDRIVKSCLDVYFEQIIIAEEDLGCQKDDPRFAKKLIEKIVVEPYRCVVIGDKINADLNPAKVAGMSSIQAMNHEYPDRWPYCAESINDWQRMINALSEGVFISYAHEDMAFVTKLEQRLQRDTIVPWLDKRIPIGTPIHEAIGAAIARNSVILIVISKHSVASNWVKLELGMAIASYTQTANKRVVPVLTEVSSEEIPIIISPFKGVDFRCRDFEAAYSELCTRILEALGRND